MIKIKEIGFCPIGDDIWKTEEIMGIWYEIRRNNEIIKTKYQLSKCTHGRTLIIGYYKTVEKSIYEAQEHFESLIKEWIEE